MQVELLGLVLDQVVQRDIEEGEPIERGSGSRLVGDSWFGGGEGSRLLLRCRYVEAVLQRLLLLRILLRRIEVGRLLVVSAEYVIEGHLLQGAALLVARVLRRLEFVVLPEDEELHLVLEGDHPAREGVQLVAGDKLAQLYNRYVGG